MRGENDLCLTRVQVSLIMSSAPRGVYYLFILCAPAGVPDRQARGVSSIAASRIDIPVLRNMASAALSISVSFVFIISWIRNPRITVQK